MHQEFDHLQALANTNLELPDVLGQIQSVQGSDLKDAAVMTRVMVRFVVELVWSCTFVCGTMLQQCLEVSSTHSKVYSQLQSYYTIWFQIRNPNRRKLDKSVASLRCNITGVIKYRVELLVGDGNDNATFVVFDREMLKLTTQDAAGLTLDEMNGGGGNELPQCLQELAGKDFVFQMHVISFSFTPMPPYFSVSAIIDHFNPETFNTTEVELPQLPATRLDLRGMNQIHPALMGKRVAVKAPVSEATKLSHRQPNFCFCLFSFSKHFLFKLFLFKTLMILIA